MHFSDSPVLKLDRKFSIRAQFSPVIRGVLLALLLGAPHVFAANYTWDGGGGDNNFSTKENWSSDVTPGSGDNVTFNSTSTKDCIISVSASVGNFTIGAGYTGTITTSTSSIVTLSVSGTFAQNAGTFTLGL